MLQEESFKIIEAKCRQQVELDLIYANIDYKNGIIKLENDISKLIQQNKILNEKLKDYSKISHNAQQDKINFDAIIDGLKNELSTKSKDLANALEENERFRKNEEILNFKSTKSKVNHHKEKNKLEYLLLLARTMHSTSCKENRDLNQNKIVMQKQLDALVL